MYINKMATASSTISSEHLFKVLVIGEFGVGKTAVIRRYVDDSFNPNYKLTIGVDFALKTIQWDTDTRVNLQLWDIAGHERFGHMTRVYYKYAIAAIIVFDLSRPATFDSVPKWLNDVNSKVMLANEDPVPIMLLANKSDVENVSVDESSLNSFCKSHNINGWFATSAKDNINVEECMRFIVGKILELPRDTQPREDQTSITLPGVNSGSSGGGRHEAFDDSFEEEERSRSKPAASSSSCCS